MKAKFGMVVVAGSGKIGGHVASRNRAGAYFRTKVTPVNPQTASQTSVRSLLTTLSQAWRALTEAQRAAWNSAVSSFARTDIFGDIKNPTGFNLYQRLNNNLAQAGQAFIDEPPLPGEVPVGVFAQFLYDLDGPSFVIDTTSVPAGTTLLVDATAPQSPGKSFVKSEFRRIATFPAATSMPAGILAQYTAKFGAGQEGQKVFVRVKFVNNVTGQVSQEQTLSGLIVDNG